MRGLGTIINVAGGLSGSMLIFCVGMNLLWEKKVKVANLLPTIIYAAILSIWM